MLGRQEKYQSSYMGMAFLTMLYVQKMEKKNYGTQKTGMIF